ncbi:hypothetical protein PSm6_04470 [Pseudomonas solani]|uniref:Lipoprotein n=1 Tax=Pseudomonas solani TaxID=2731552 RepID=A0ABN6BNL4_9PSED|nr:hypothetical protein [Pseudomonas solani]BCD84040.1 hypothetical protein PSm6_04470 [Pseudomonas solani]
MKKSLLSCAVLTLLAACQSSPPPASASQETEEQRFVRLAQASLRNAALVANNEMLVGSVGVTVDLDSRGWITGCETGPVVGRGADIAPFNQRLATRLADLCWNVVLPPVPASMSKGDEAPSIRAPLVFPALSLEQLQEQMRRSALFARDNYLWHTLFANEPIDAIGRATFRIAPDPKGQVQTCKVTLKPHPARVREFQANEALRARLEQGCNRLNPREMPFYTQPPTGKSYSVDVQYMPWKKKLKVY